MTKRRLLIIMLLLVAGAIVNVAVAWGGGATIALPSGRGQDALTKEEVLELCQSHGIVAATGRPAGWRRQEIAASALWFGSNLGANDIGRFVGFANDAQLRDVLIIQSGWPSRSLYHKQFDVVSTSVLPGKRYPIDDHAKWLLDSHVLWPGFAINTLFYAAILWLLFAAPIALRRWRRIKRGLCPACAYPVGESEVCTECGAPHAEAVSRRQA